MGINGVNSGRELVDTESKSTDVAQKDWLFHAGSSQNLKSPSTARLIWAHVLKDSGGEAPHPRYDVSQTSVYPCRKITQLDELYRQNGVLLDSITY